MGGRCAAKPRRASDVVARDAGYLNIELIDPAENGDHAHAVEIVHVSAPDLVRLPEFRHDPTAPFRGGYGALGAP